MFSSATSTTCRLVPAGRVWLCDDDLGLSRAPSYALHQDHHGYLWIGSERGPVRFDGLAWEVPAGLAPLGACIVRGFAAAPDGALWLATDNAGLVCLDLDATPYRITARLGTAESLPSTTVNAVCVDRRGQVWTATNGGVALIADGRVRRRPADADGLPAERAWTLCCDDHGRVWVGLKDGLALIDGETVTRIATTDATGAARGVQVVCRDPRGYIVVGLAGGAVCRVVATETAAGAVGAGWVLAPLAETGARVRALCPDAQGRLWVGTGAGVRALDPVDGTVIDTWDRADGLPVQGVWALGHDRAGRVWASTSVGLALLARPAPPARPLPAAADAPQGLVFACQPDGQGRVWIASEQGLSAVDAAGEAPAPLPPLPAAVVGQLVWALRLDHRGFLWVGTDRAGLVCLDPATGALLAQFAADRRVPALCLEPEPEEGGARRLWASVAAEGVLCVDVDTRQVMHQVGHAQGLPPAVVYGLHADGRGRLWAGTWAGDLLALDTARGAIVDTLTLNDDQAQRPIMDLAGDAAGRLWCATYGGGLVRVDPTRPAVTHILTAREGAPGDILYACLVDPHGDLWLGTARGLARYTPAPAGAETEADTEANAGGRWAVIGRGLGLPSEECNARALHLDGQGRLWVGTVGVVATERIAAKATPCPVYLTGLTIMGQDRALTPRLEIEDSDYDLVFSYGAVAFTAPHQVLYRVHLAGLERDWSPPTPHRFARYTNLRPGAYTFRVAACDWGGQWSAPVEASFRVVRNRQARALEEALERERIDKEVALATAAVFERLALQDGLTGLLNRRALDERLAQEVERARRHGHPLTVALGDIDHFKRINDTYRHQVGDEVLKAVARLCQATVRAGDNVGRYGGEEIALVLPETTVEEGTALCERLRRAIVGHDWEAVAPGLCVTISIGLSDRLDAPHPAALLADADAHLYRAKQGGRNRTCGAVGPPSLARRRSS